MRGRQQEFNRKVCGGQVVLGAYRRNEELSDPGEHERTVTYVAVETLL